MSVGVAKCTYCPVHCIVLLHDCHKQVVAPHHCCTEQLCCCYMTLRTAAAALLLLSDDVCAGHHWWWWLAYVSVAYTRPQTLLWRDLLPRYEPTHLARAAGGFSCVLYIFGHPRIFMLSHCVEPHHTLSVPSLSSLGYVVGCTHKKTLNPNP